MLTHSPHAFFCIKLPTGLVSLGRILHPAEINRADQRGTVIDTEMKKDEKADGKKKGEKKGK